MKLSATLLVPLLAVLLANVTLAAEPAQGTPEEAAIALSPYEITAGRSEFERWIKVGSPNFILYTDTRVEEAMTLLQQMEMLRLTIQDFFGRRARSQSPMLVVLPTASSDWRKIQSRGGVEWKVAISVQGGNVARITLAQYDWKADGLYLLWTALTRPTVEALNIDMAFWFGRGIGSFFETAQFTADTLKIGVVNIRALHVHFEGQLSWPRFFAVTAKSPEFTKDTKVMHQYSGQCAAFVQYLLANKDPVWLPRLLIWNALMRAGREPTEELFKEVFGQDWKEWTKTMESYLASGAYNIYTLRIPESVKNMPRKQHPLRTTEMRELFILSQILNQDVPDSEVSLDTLLARGLKTEHLRELLVEACRDKNRKEATLVQLQHLIETGSTNPSVYAAAAQAVFDRCAPTPSIHARVDAESLAMIRSWCGKAIELEPIHAQACTILAWAEALAPEVDATSVETVGNLCRAMDGNGTTDQLIAALAVARWRAGALASARTASQLLVDSPLSSTICRDLARSVLTELDRAPAAE